MNPSPRVVSVVGPSGVGKTTLVEQLIRGLRDRGLIVGTVKHAPHGFEVDRPGADSWRHRDAGADRVLLAGADRAVLFLDGGLGPGSTSDEPSAGHHRGAHQPSSVSSDSGGRVEPIATWVSEHFAACDVVLVEGFSAVSEVVIAVARHGIPAKPVDRSSPPTITVTDRPDGTARQIGFDQLDELIDLILEVCPPGRNCTDRV